MLQTVSPPFRIPTRDQQTQVEKRTGTGSGTYAGKVEYQYCSMNIYKKNIFSKGGGALAHRIEYNPSVSTTIDSWKRYEYDGLKLLRVDERYDNDNPADGIDSSDPWRTLESSTHGPGLIGNLLAKRVYTHNDNNATPDATNDYYYAYDHIGNVHLVLDGDGKEVYHFSQDAFGNELDFGDYTGDTWATSAANGISEHQTGKWIDDFSGLYFFSARWYDSEVGRFVGRDPLMVSPNPYEFSISNPIRFFDPDGRQAFMDDYLYLNNIDCSTLQCPDIDFPCVLNCALRLGIPFYAPTTDIWNEIPTNWSSGDIEFTLNQFGRAIGCESGALGRAAMGPWRYVFMAAEGADFVACMDGCIN